MRNYPMKPIERPKSLCDIAVNSIRNAITQGTYELGQPLSEALLVQSLGISKTPIREALAVLKLEGLVSVIPQKGTFVFTLSGNEVSQLALYRYALELTAMEMAMERDTKILISNLLQVCDCMEKARSKGKEREYLELDAEFHQAIFKNCGNRYLQDGYQFVNGKIAALRNHLSTHPTHTEKSFHEHLEITKLLKKGDIDAAKAILRRHITRGERSYADTVNDIAKVDQQTGINMLVRG